MPISSDPCGDLCLEPIGQDPLCLPGSPPGAEGRTRGRWEPSSPWVRVEAAPGRERSLGRGRSRQSPQPAGTGTGRIPHSREQRHPQTRATPFQRHGGCVCHRQGPPRDRPRLPLPGHVGDPWGRGDKTPREHGVTPLGNLGGSSPGAAGTLRPGTPTQRQGPLGKGKDRHNRRPPIPGTEGDTVIPPPLWAAEPPPPRQRDPRARTAPALTVCARSGLRAAAGGSAAGMETAIMARGTASTARGTAGPRAGRAGAGAGEGPPRAPMAGTVPEHPGAEQPQSLSTPRPAQGEGAVETPQGAGLQGLGERKEGSQPTLPILFFFLRQKEYRF